MAQTTFAGKKTRSPAAAKPVRQIDPSALKISGRSGCRGPRAHREQVRSRVLTAQARTMPDLASLSRRRS